MTDTLVSMAKKAERLEPAPKPGSVWDRIEQARVEKNLNPTKFAKLAGRSPRHYAGLPARGWGATLDVAEDFIRALAELGVDEQWLRTGDPVGDTTEIEKAAALLVLEGHSYQRAANAVRAALSFAPARAPLKAERAATFARSLLDTEARLEGINDEVHESVAPSSRRKLDRRLSKDRRHRIPNKVGRSSPESHES